MADAPEQSSMPNPTGKEIVISENTSITKPHGKEIITQTETTNLLTLKPTDLDKCIHVKVYRKWTILNKASVPAMYCCILLDQQGGAIQANTKPREKDRFNILEIDKAYTIKGFGFQDATGWMQTVNHPFSLAFGRYTDIQPAPDTGFPAHHFNFVQYSELHSKLDKKEGLLTDYVGCIQYVSDLLESTMPTKEVTYWRDIRIQNLDGMSVRFTLWNEKARNFNMKEYEESEKPATIAVSSCIVKIYGGLQLSSTAATYCYLNPDIPEATEIRSVYNCFLEPPTILSIQYQRYADIEQEKQRNRVKLADLLTENPQHHQNVRFTVVATVDSIHNRMPWFYTRCTTCHSKVSERFPHAHCRQRNPNTATDYSYCFKAFISDDTGTIMLTCFSDEAHSIVPGCNEVIQKLQDKDPYRVPPELAAIEQKTYIFQLHYGSDSTKEQRFFFLDKAWDVTPTIAAPPETTLKAMTAKTKGETEGTSSATVITVTDANIKTPPTKAEVETKTTPIPIVTSIPETNIKTPPPTPDIEPNTTPPPTQEHVNITESSSMTAEKKTNKTRRTLFETTKSEAQKPSAKKSKKDN